MNNEEKHKEPEIISESITLSEFIDDYGWDFFVSKQYKRHQITKEDFLNAKDSYLAELSEIIYQRRLHRAPFCMRLRSELGIPDPYLLR